MAKGIIVNLDGKKDRKLRFTFNSATDFEDVMGFSLFNAMQNMGIKTIRALYWAGLKHEEKGLTLQRTGKMLDKAMDDGEDFESLLKPLMEALQDSGFIPKDEDEEDDAPEDSEDDEEEEKNE